MSERGLARAIGSAMLLGVLLLTAEAAAEPRYPGRSWDRAASPETMGWSADKLRGAREYAATIHTAAVMVIVDGVVLDEWGETGRRFNIHSIRKSLLSALYGIHVKEGRIELGKTLAELGIDDNEPSLTATEKQATVADLLKARSGVYHAALYETPGMAAARPARGSYPPGTFWYYNNWDFNALGTIFEHATKTGIFEDFKKRLAEPLEMEDYRVEDGSYVRGADSIHPAYPLRMTARDLARFGLLYLRDGAWRGRQLVPKEWSTRARARIPIADSGAVTDTCGGSRRRAARTSRRRVSRAASSPPRARADTSSSWRPTWTWSWSTG